jgi:hypothetical protein
MNFILNFILNIIASFIKSSIYTAGGYTSDAIIYTSDFIKSTRQEVKINIASYRIHFIL